MSQEEMVMPVVEGLSGRDIKVRFGQRGDNVELQVYGDLEFRGKIVRKDTPIIDTKNGPSKQLKYMFEGGVSVTFWEGTEGWQNLEQLETGDIMILELGLVSATQGSSASGGDVRTYINLDQIKSYDFELGKFSTEVDSRLADRAKGRTIEYKSKAGSGTGNAVSGIGRRSEVGSTPPAPAPPASNAPTTPPVGDDIPFS